MPPSLVTLPEALVASACTTVATVITVGYLWGRVGQIAPWGVLAVALATLFIVTKALRRCAGNALDRSVIAAGVGLSIVLAGWLLYLAWPTFLPPGRGPDLTHHLMLVDFIERNWRLPDASMVPVMVEMAHYTPGIHLLAALAGAWTGTDGFRAVYPVLVFTVVLKCVLLMLIAARAVPGGRGRIPLALAAVVVCALPTRYVFGSFVEDSFLAQVAAELFAVAMWWAVALWDNRPSALAATLFGIMGVGAFLTWPMWVGPPMVTFAAIALTHDARVLRTRLAHLALGLGPVAAIAAIHTAGRVGWLAIAGTTGIVLQPSVEVFGWPFVAIAAIGLLAAPLRRESRVSLVLTLSIVAQAATLYAVADARGAAIPYMAFKMMYLIIFPLGVLGAVAGAALVERVPALAPRAMAIALAVLLATGVALVMSLSGLPKTTPIVSPQLYEAGRWARGHVEAACVDYLVPNHETMHWLHLAVLGNPRSSMRTADPATFDPQKALVRWVEPAGLPYAIAHLPTLPNDLVDNVDVLERFGDAAVVIRRGPSSCADAQRLAGGESRTP